MRAPKAILLTAVVALVLAGGAIASTDTYKDGPLTATFSAGTHHPNCKQKWPVTVTARLNGKPAHASAFYQFMYNGQVVAKRYPYAATPRNRHNRLWYFFGRFTDNTFGPFGALSVGQHLVVRAVVKAGRYTAYPSYAVTVVRASGCPAVR
jgi:hypothetical protein